MLCPSVYSVTIDGIGVKKQCSELAHLSWIIYRNTTTAAASAHSPETVPLTKGSISKRGHVMPSAFAGKALLAFSDESPGFNHICPGTLRNIFQHQVFFLPPFIYTCFLLSFLFFLILNINISTATHSPIFLFYFLTNFTYKIHQISSSSTSKYSYPFVFNQTQTLIFTLSLSFFILKFYFTERRRMEREKKIKEENK